MIVIAGKPMFTCDVRLFAVYKLCWQKERVSAQLFNKNKNTTVMWSLDWQRPSSQSISILTEQHKNSHQIIHESRRSSATASLQRRPLTQYMCCHFVALKRLIHPPGSAYANSPTGPEAVQIPKKATRRRRRTQIKPAESMLARASSRPGTVEVTCVLIACLFYGGL